MKGTIKLSELTPGEVGTIVRVEGEDIFRRRLLDMGFTKGVTVTVLDVAPLGDPMKLEIREYEISIRKKQAEKIIVSEG